MSKKTLATILLKSFVCACVIVALFVAFCVGVLLVPPAEISVNGCMLFVGILTVLIGGVIYDHRGGR